MNGYLIDGVAVDDLEGLERRELRHALWQVAQLDAPVEQDGVELEELLERVRQRLDRCAVDEVEPLEGVERAEGDGLPDSVEASACAHVVP